MTTKGLRHVQICENAIRECIDSNLVSVKHISAEENLADLFTKEQKDSSRLVKIRDIMMSVIPPTQV